MRTIYAVRHQAEGIVTSHLFVEQPTEAQMAALRAELERRHNLPDMWMRVIPVLLLEPGEIPWAHLREEQSGGEPGKATIASMFTVSGEGKVE